MEPQRYKLTEAAKILNINPWRRILLSKARRKGYDREKEILAQIRSKRDELIAEKFYRLEAVDRTPVSEEEIRRFYETHQEEYGARPVVWVQEILVKTEEEANRFLTQLVKGTDMGDLAKEYSIRQETREHEGKMRLTNLFNHSIIV